MINYWQTIIEQQATLNVDEETKVKPCFIPLNQLGVLQISGEDAPVFLQNLVTNDVSALAINQAQLNGFCNAKGRLFALFMLIHRSDSFQLVLPKDMCVLLRQRLSMYILRSKVTILDVSDHLVCLGLTDTVNSIEMPQNLYHTTDIQNALFIKYSDLNPYFLCLAEPQHAAELIQKLQNQAWHLTTENHWNQIESELGLPAVYSETKEKFTPQQVNLDLIDGVSFKKGCYPGQEIVARLHYLGEPSRRMFIAEAQASKLPKPGDEITNDEGNVAGHVVRAQFKDSNTIQFLLSLKLSDEKRTIFINLETAITIQPHPLIK